MKQNENLKRYQEAIEQEREERINNATTGYYWTCLNCHWLNPEDDNECSKCGEFDSSCTRIEQLK